MQRFTNKTCNSDLVSPNLMLRKMDFTLAKSSPAAHCTLWPRPSKQNASCPAPVSRPLADRWSKTVLRLSASAPFFFFLAEPAGTEAACFWDGEAEAMAGGFAPPPPALAQTATKSGGSPLQLHRRPLKSVRLLPVLGLAVPQLLWTPPCLPRSNLLEHQTPCARVRQWTGGAFPQQQRVVPCWRKP